MSYKTDFSKIDLNKYYFDESAADLAVRYIEKNIRHVKGELSGQLIKLEDWQKNEIIRPLFGWKHKDTGYRKYTSAYIEIPKKNGKTFISASLAAIFLDIEGELGEVPIFSIAGNKDQARLSFEDTKGIVMQSKRLMSKAKIFRSSIVVGSPPNMKYFKPMARDSKTQEGINPQLAIVDELHVHPNGDLIENMEKSMASRRQPLSFVITTAGADLNGIGYKRHEYAIDVVNGVINDENQLVCIYCADKDDDPFSEETWIKANPNYNVSVYKSSLEREVAKAKYSTASLNQFLRYHLNIWTSSRDGWIEDHVWQSNPKEIVLDNELRGLECSGGLDLSTSSDFSAFSLVWEWNGGYLSKNWFFVPESVQYNAADKYNINILDWVKAEHITLTPGNTVDHDYIFAKIMELAEAYNIKKIYFDRFKAEYIIPKLVNEGLECEACGQGYVSLLNPLMELEKSIKDGKFNHQGNPVLRWMAGNCEVQADQNGNKKLVKDAKRPDKKIDGIISNIMALKGIIKEDEGTSYLENEEMFSV